MAAAETLRESILPALRQGDEAVAGGRDAGADAASLPAQDEDRGAAEVDVPGRVSRAGVGAPDPEAGLLRFAEPVGEVADAGDRQVLDRARRGLAGDRRSPPPPAVRG